MICARGGPLHLLVALERTWVASAVGPTILPGYAAVFSKRHVVEPFELTADEQAAFWEECMLVAGAIRDVFGPRKLNYEIHGNTVPHLHLHIYPRYPDDPFIGRPIDARESPRYRHTAEDLARLREAIATARGG